MRDDDVVPEFEQPLPSQIEVIATHFKGLLVEDPFFVFQTPKVTNFSAVDVSWSGLEEAEWATVRLNGSRIQLNVNRILIHHTSKKELTIQLKDSISPTKTIVRLIVQVRLDKQEENKSGT